MRPITEIAAPAADSTTRRVMRWVLAAFYLVAGVLHLRSPEVLLAIMPGFVPFPREVILATGVAEIAGAVGLLLAPTRRLAGILFALYAVCVFPANIKHALDGIVVPGLPSGWWYHAPRLAFQPVLIWWALFCTRVVDWPARR